MPDITHRVEEFQPLVQPLVGLTVSLPWKGYGSAIFFELGALVQLESRRQQHNKGEACIAVEWDWRVEAGATVLYGSSNSRPEIELGIAALQSRTIQGLSIAGQVPEITVHFSNGHCLRSMAMVTGDPGWSVRRPDGTWVYAKGGSLLVGVGTRGATEQESAVYAVAERTASRGGVPVAPLKRGSCVNCISFVPLDGDGHLLDYGVCTADSGPFDGRAVHRSSGCPLFHSYEET